MNSEEIETQRDQIQKKKEVNGRQEDMEVTLLETRHRNSSVTVPGDATRHAKESISVMFHLQCLNSPKCS